MSWAFAIKRAALVAYALIGAGGLGSAATPHASAVPSHFPPPPAHPENPTTPAGVALGERLFHDPRLSHSHGVSCATCHEAKHAFTIPEARPTRGITHRPLARNPPALINLAWAETGLFWDGGSKNLESLSLAPLLHPDEMGREGDLEKMVGELANDAEYPALFAAAFAEGAVSIENVMKSIAQYERSLVFATSRWDELVRDETKRWTADERLGGDVFQRDCARCHTPPLFTDFDYHDNGLDSSFGPDPEAPSRGRGRVTFADSDIGKYRTPTLRNVSVTGPYMHDGRFGTLEAVVDHYRHGMKDSPALDPWFQKEDGTRGISMTDREATVLLAFLDLLTDHTLR